MKTYSELIKLDGYEERLKYLSLSSPKELFGENRYVNQMFYTSAEWKEVRQTVILRDNACDLGVPGYDITSRIMVHHMNPITLDDIINFKPYILDPEYLISVSLYTHNLIHNSVSDLSGGYRERTKNDTLLWGK